MSVSSPSSDDPRIVAGLGRQAADRALLLDGSRRLG
jgi:hypothetical protein